MKFVACTFIDAMLSRWNNHTKTIGIDNANSLSWADDKQMFIEEYCPREEITKLEQ